MPTAKQQALFLLAKQLNIVHMIKSGADLSSQDALSSPPTCATRAGGDATSNRSSLTYQNALVRQKIVDNISYINP